MPTNPRIRANLALACVCFFWGTTYAAIRLAVHPETMPPASMAGVRFFVAGILMMGFALWRGHSLPGWRDLARLSVVGLLLLFLANGLVVWSEQFLASSLVALVVTGTPFFFVGVSRLCGDRVPWLSWVGMAVGFLGIGVLLWPDLSHQVGHRAMSAEEKLACLAALGASCSWAIGSVYAQRRPAKDTSKFMGIAVQMTVAGLALLVLATARGEWRRFSPDATQWLATLYLVVVGSWIGFGCYIYCLAHLPATRISIYSYINPVVAVLLGAFLLHEPLTRWTIAGSAIVIMGVIIVNFAKSLGARETRVSTELRLPAEPLGNARTTRLATLKP